MNRRTGLTGVVLFGCLVCLAATGADRVAHQTAASSASAQQSADPVEADIRAGAANFAAAFARGDAVGLARHWTADGDYIDEHGQRFVGRAAIEAEYEAFFRQHGAMPMHIVVDSVRLIAPDTAIEDGRAVLGSFPAGPPAFSRYTAVHVRHDGQWLMAAVRDARVEAAEPDEQITE